MLGIDLSTTLRRIGPALVLAAPTVACTDAFVGEDGEAEPVFRVTGLDYNGQGGITLTFSEALANPGEVDPLDFRISVGVSHQSSSSVGTTYVEIGQIWYYDYGPERLEFDSVTPGPGDDQLTFETNAGSIQAACSYLANVSPYGPYEGVTEDRGMFIHYAAGDIPIRSETDETLADIGPDWVNEPGGFLNLDTFGFTQLGTRVEIPCN